MKEITEFTERIVDTVKESNIESTGNCPVCKSQIMEKEKLYGCTNWKEGNCEFKVWKQIAGKTLTPENVKELLTKKKTKPIEGFKNKKGSLFTASLKLEKDGNVSFDFDFPQKTIGKCPLCDGDIVESPKAFGCSNWKEKKCKFAIWKTIAGKKITEKIAKTLMENKRTEKLSGFKSKAGNDFETTLVLGDDGKITFEF